MDKLTILLIALVIFFSAFVQGFSGFAFSLVLIPLLGIFYPSNEVIVLNILFSFILNVSVFFQISKHAKIRYLMKLIGFAVVFTILGAYFVNLVNQNILKIILGLLLIISSTLKLLNLHLTFQNPKKWYILVGSITGFLNGICGISGPPLILFFSGVKMDKMTYKATFNSIFLALNVVAIISYYYFGNLTITLVKTSLTYAVIVIIGAFLGLFVSKRISEVLFSKIISITVIIMGLWMIVGAL